MYSQGLKSEIASRGAVAQLLLGSTRVMSAGVVNHNMQAFSVYNVENVSWNDSIKVVMYRGSSHPRRRRETRRRTQVMHLMLSSLLLRKRLPPLLKISLSPLLIRVRRRLSTLIRLSTSHSPLEMLRRSSPLPITNLPTRKTPSKGDTQVCSSQLPLKRAPFTTSTKT